MSDRINVVDFPGSTLSERGRPGGFDGHGGSGDDGGMEERLRKLETDVAVIKSNYATREDVRALGEGIHKEMREQTWKFVTWMSTICAALVAATYFIAQHAK